ncbi:MAG: SEC-C domain-containing protein, partial [Alphaproteobacteria bacterium]|nr:SEC-C domain-containing protein [Alphaproteobacteria bacterium]
PVEEWVKEQGVDAETFVEKVTAVIDESQKQKNKDVPENILRLVEKSILLQELDTLWKDHIATLDYMRHTIVLRAYGQKDPLNEYKKEAFNLFSDMLNQLGEKVAFIILRTVIQQNSAASDLEERNARQSKMEAVHESPVNLLSGKSDEPTEEEQKQTPFTYGNQAVDPKDPNTWGKVARNDPCPCGSGKKYKHCHGQV